MQPVGGNGTGPGPPPGHLQVVHVTDEQQSSVKQRKPYTLQKAREKWTDEEHNKFVEGLRLHGRQWRKIEGKAVSECCCGANPAVCHASQLSVWDNICVPTTRSL